MSDEIIDATTIQVEEPNSGSAPKSKLPSDTVAMVLGILSIPFCLGFLGPIFAIFALINGNKGIKTYNANPDGYFESSLKKVKVAKTCGIIGICLTGLALIIVILAVAADA